MKVIYDENTQRVIDACDKTLKEYEKHFKKKHSNFEPHDFQKAWLNDENRKVILKTKSRILERAIPTGYLI